MSSDEKVEISRPIKIEDKIEPDDIKAELLFLISKYLEASDLKDVSEISSMRVDWEGAEHQMSLSEMLKIGYLRLCAKIRESEWGNTLVEFRIKASEFNDIPNDHLYISLVKVLETLRSQKDGPHSGVTSLLSSRFPNQICLTFLISKLQNLVLVHRLIKLLLVSVKIDQNPVKTILQMPYRMTTHRDKIEFKKSIFHHIELKKQVLGHLASTYCVTFDRTGQRIITGSDDTLIKIWCTSTSQLVSTLRGHAAEICDLAVSNDNKLLASASCDKTVRIWLLQTAAEVCILHGHTSALSSVQFCPRSLENKKYLISTGNDANLCVWSYEDTNFSIEPVKFTEKLKSTSRLVCSSFSPGGKYLVLGSTDARIYVYSIEEEVIKIGDFEAHEDRIDSVDFNHSGEKFLTASNGGQAKIWYPRLSSWSSLSLSTSKDQDSSDEVKKIISVSWSVDDNFIFGSVHDFSVYIWNASNGEVMHRFQTHTDSVFIVESHPSFQSIFLTAGHDGRIIIWDFLAQDPIIKILFNKVNEGVGAVFDAKFSPANFSIAATDNHGNVCIYGMETSEDFIAFPDQQFFHTDYRPICVEDNVTYDEQTGMLPHEMYPPYMVNMDGDPHPSIFQQAHLNRFNIFDKYELERLGFYKLKAENNPTIGSLQAGIAEGVRQIENIHITTPIETEDVRKWRKRIIVPQLTSDRLYEVRSRVQNLYKQECEFYKNIEKSFSPQKLNDIGRKKKLLSLKAKILQSRNAATVEVIEEPVQESPIQTVHEVIQSEESSFVTDSEFTTEVEYVDSSQSSECDVKREICTRRNRYIFNDDRQSSTTPSTDPIYNVQNPTITKDWLLVEKQMRSPYFPQVGDVVTYHLLGHKMYVNHVCNNKLFYINKNRLCYNRIKFKDVEICRVTNANFFDIYPYLCSLTLTKLDASGTYSTGLNFNVQFTDIYNVDDFLVLKQFYDEAVARHWNEGNRFQSYIDEEWFYGTIEEIVYNERFPESYFRNLKVRWNSGESDTLSPWDVFPISTRTPNVKYREEEADWAPETKAEAKHRILAGFEAIQLTQQFRDVEDYLNENSADIPFATSYCKIIRKISNDFYRRKKAIIWELRMILHNLGSLKAPSNIMENSEILTKSLIYFIKNLCYNVAEIIDSTTVNSELGAAESTDSCILRRSSRRKEVVLPEFRWFMEAIDLWNDLTGLTDAQPFLAPVDVEEYPDYLSVIKTPMDFSKVHHNLMSGNYLTPDQFINDINLIFQNSRSYNVNRRSTIYGMTLRLNNFFNKKLDRLLPRWRAENLNSNAHLTRHKISQFLGNLNQNGSQSVVESKQRMRKLTINETNSTPIARRLRKRKPADNGSVVDDTDISISIDNKPPPQNSSNKPRRRSKRFVEDPDAQSTSPLQSPIIKATKRIYRTRASAKFMLKESSNNTPSTSFSNPTSTDSSPKRKPRSKKNKIRKRKSSLQDSGSVNTSISPSELDDLREISLKYNLRSKRPEVGENRISARLRKRKK